MSVTDKPIPPGSFGLPFIGETHKFITGSTYLTERQNLHGNIVRTHILGRPTAVLYGEEANRFILSKGMEHFSWGEGWPKNFRVLLGRSLFLMDGEEHKRNRRLITPAFHGQALVGYLQTMDEIVRKYLRRWEQLEEFAWFIEFKKMTFEIASTLLIGSEPGAENDQLSQYFTDLTNGLFAVPINLPWTAYGKAIRARDALLAFVDEQITKRRHMKLEELNGRPDALTLLVHSRDENGEQLDHDELKAQAILLLFAGHETTTSMLTSSCYFLAKHPEILAKARAEQAQIDLSDPPLIEEFRQMTYLDNFLKEVERITPPVAGGFRGVIKPFEFNGYHVPAGWQVQYGILRTHYDEMIFKDPDQFTPERFEDATISPFSLVGFGSGPRICIGKAFALLEMKLMLAYLLRYFTWELKPEQDLTMVPIPTLRPKDDLLVRFQRKEMA